MNRHFYFLILVLALNFNVSSNGQVAIRPGGKTGICTNTALNRTTYGIPTIIDTLIIRETHPGDFALGWDTIIIKLPAGWRLGSGTPLYLGNSVHDFDSLTVSWAWDSIVIYARSPTVTSLDTVSIGGLSVIPVTDTTPAGYMWAKSLQGIAGITVGPAGTSFGNLSVAPGKIFGNYFLPDCLTGQYIDSTGGGTWHISNTSIATIDSVTGLLSGMVLRYGIDTIFYTLPNTCSISKVIEEYVCEGVEQIENSNHISLFPNPVYDFLTIEQNGLYTSYSITDMLGRTFLQNSVENKQTTCDVTSLKPGIYFITMKRESGNATGRFVKM
jgi:Secretion system C-terminal sorting domain